MGVDSIASLAGSIKTLWSFVAGAFGFAISAGAAAGVLMWRVRSLEKNAHQDRVKHAELERRVNARLYRPDGSVIYCSVDECRRYRAACGDGVTTQIDELKRIGDKNEARNEERHKEMQEILRGISRSLGRVERIEK